MKNEAKDKNDLEAFFREEVLENYGVRRVFKAGTVIFREGEKGDYLFVIVSGKIKVFVTSKGEERVIAELGHGDVVGEMAVLTGKPRSATVQALEDAEVYIIDRDGLSSIFRDHPLARGMIMAESVRREEENVGRMLEDEGE